jgi:hypothetical protein
VTWVFYGAEWAALLALHNAIEDRRQKYAAQPDNLKSHPFGEGADSTEVEYYVTRYSSRPKGSMYAALREPKRPRVRLQPQCTLPTLDVFAGAEGCLGSGGRTPRLRVGCLPRIVGEGL